MLCWHYFNYQYLLTETLNVPADGLILADEYLLNLTVTTLADDTNAVKVLLADIALEGKPRVTGSPSCAQLIAMVKSLELNVAVDEKSRFAEPVSTFQLYIWYYQMKNNNCCHHIPPYRFLL